MFQVAVTYYLVLALSVGPAAFCCCAPKALADSLQSAAAKTKSAPAEVPPVCPHCKKHQDETPPFPEKSPVPEKGSDDGCPCRQGGTATLPDAVPDNARVLPSADLPSAVLSLGVVGLFSVDLLATNRHGPLTGGRDGPWLTASDLLSLHHVIRC